MPCECQPLLTLDQHGQWHGEISTCRAHVALAFMLQELIAYYQEQRPIPESFWANALAIYDELYPSDMMTT